MALLVVNHLVLRFQDELFQDFHKEGSLEVLFLC